MNTQSNDDLWRVRHPSPPIGIVAILFTVLFLAGLYPVQFNGKPYFPGPWMSASDIAAYFQTRQSAALICAFFQFGAAIPLGIFTASIVSRLRFLGVQAAGVQIAFFGGIATSFTMIVSSSILWAMVHPGIAQDTALIKALYYMEFALGGPGFSAPMGLLMAGVSVSAAVSHLMPKGIAAPGILLAVAGVLSWLSLILPGALFLIPLTRFPGFIWLIAVGFALPSAIDREGASRVPALSGRAA
jgi:hypothetical protein